MTAYSGQSLDRAPECAVSGSVKLSNALYDSARRDGTAFAVIKRLRAAPMPVVEAAKKAMSRTSR